MSMTCLLFLVFFSGDATSGKSAITQVFHSDGSHFPKNYTMVSLFVLRAPGTSSDLQQ